MKTPGFPLAVTRAAVATIGTIAVLAASPLDMLPSARAQDEIEFPETGTPAERAKKLWQASRTRVLADAKAALSDAEYQKRRAPIWGAWSRLQMSIAGKDDRVSDVIPDVLGLLNDVYGWTAFPPAERQEIRDRTRPFVEKRVAEMDERLEALK
jgi:hypothetical protein